MKVTSLYGGYLIIKDLVIKPYEVDVEASLEVLDNRSIKDLYKLLLARKITVVPESELIDAYKAGNSTDFVTEGMLSEKIAELSPDLSGYALNTEVSSLDGRKVEKQAGKALSANDFSNGYKTQLDGFESNVSGKISSAIGGVVGGAPASFDTLKEISDWIEAETIASANKVDKISGKGLSTNDYTTAEKSKLSGIAANANNFTLPVGTSGQVLKHNGTSWSAGADTVGPVYTNATTTVAGLMSSTDKVKLDGLTNVSIIQLTQVAYDALPPLEKNKDNVLYIIVG